MNSRSKVVRKVKQDVKTMREADAEEAVGRLREIGLKKLSVPDVLEALRRDGIQDLEHLVRNQLELATSQVYHPDNLNLYSPSADLKNDARIVHRVPLMPVNIDGVLYDPADIRRFDGQVLHFVARPDSDGSQLDGYTGNQWSTALRTYFQVRHMLSLFDSAPVTDLRPVDFPIPFLPPTGGPTQPNPTPFIPLPGSPGSPHPPTQPPPPPSPPPRPTESQFFSDNNFGGDWLWLGARLAWNDLTKVSRAKFLFFSSDWNDVISSIRVWAGTITVYEHINEGGSSITFQQGMDIPDLNSYGFNDRISSIVNWG